MKNPRVIPRWFKIKARILVVEVTGIKSAGGLIAAVVVLTHQDEDLPLVLGMQAPPVGPPVGPPGQLNIQQTYENYNNNPGNPGNQYPGFSRDPFYNPNFQKDPSVPEKKTYKNYNMEANYHVNSNDDPSLIKKPFKSYQASVTVSHFKNEKTYSYGDN
ncbi:hypothetical protein KQX54_003931 [Cotesia glomerata]|uniref:Uncharacterized protein n=1 Tax=Cotesia glomerata TaxID=32391 RepID=A0AAV7ISL8_COTGL|nr:hypothetical protein KQX54_003931 [Cotesia glomerata]